MRPTISLPRPKWTRRSLEERKPTLVVTWLYKVRPEGGVNLNLVPIASRLLLVANRLNQQPVSAIVGGVQKNSRFFIQRRDDYIQKPSLFRSANAEPR